MTDELLQQTNPFATRFTRPGELAYLFPAGESAEGVFGRFTDAHYRGAIVGPHGSGKSTLLAELLPQLETAGRRTRFVALHDGQRSLPRAFTDDARVDDVFVVDGYEQLGWYARWRLDRILEPSGAGLLVTSHVEVRGLTTIVATQASLAEQTRLVAQLVKRLVERVDEGWLGRFVTDKEIRRLVERHNGDVREVFFELYDLYELRRS